MMGPITLANDVVSFTSLQLSTFVVIAFAILVLFTTLKQSTHSDVFPISVTNELKGLGILTVVFAHFAYMKVTNADFLFPLSIIAGVGVDLFLFMSGFGLTVGMLKRPMKAVDFYKKRVIKIFIPFWIALIIMFIADAMFMDKTYSIGYIIKSMLGFFPTADGFGDVNSPFWYITWMIMFYLIYPLVFFKDKPWLTAIILAVIATIIGTFNIFDLGSNWLHRLHTVAFSMGIILAWLLQVKEGKKNRFIEYIKDFRDNSKDMKYIIIFIMFAIVFYVSQRTGAGSWPALTSILGQGFFVEQLMSIVIMLAFTVIFILKKVDSKFLTMYGVYSYEVYLIHWPLMAKYDIFFVYLPAWAAVIAWLVAFILVSMLLQRLVTPVSNFVDKITK
ncbi:acyltransferase family protein [Aliarcobacter cryaerophilus]|uniref:Peptidoglycan/LOS O-acetylase, OafA/YrhL family n=1 Tax=Aliarcobacter cryaerophilus ATCC 43158 TaxID=1032070 RepID=A0AAD0X9D5_9BACT|nr:acyltransferase [Aliarcobacter cryaerophilus]AYJ80050.1 putative peptidoglycan/LOS O-acetylase, OafA/YrhL family [Aliarcobacter cryaerophilus ATCC 43158]